MGDPFGMAIIHAQSTGMGGVRTAGDLVARMQMSKGMRINEAKAYVAEKLGVSVEDLTDPVVMDAVREDLGIGRITQVSGNTKGIEAKFKIAELLDIKINSVEQFKKRVM